MVDRDVIRRAYACSIMLGIRAGGHAVNIGIDELAEEYEALSWTSFAVGKAMRVVMVDQQVPSPSSLAELEACSGLADVMCGSDPLLIDHDITTMRAETVASVRAAMALVSEDYDLMTLLDAFPVTRLLEDRWAA